MLNLLIFCIKRQFIQSDEGRSMMGKVCVFLIVANVVNLVRRNFIFI